MTNLKGVGSDVCNPSVVGLLQGSDEDRNGAGVVGSAVSDGQTGVPFSPLDCTPENSGNNYSGHGGIIHQYGILKRITI